MTSDTVEIDCDPGVQTIWAVEITESPAPDGDTTITRRPARDTVQIEQMISERLADFGPTVARVVHTFHGRDVHLRNGARIQFRWNHYSVDWRCLDCGVDTAAIDEYFMLHDSVWREANPDNVGMLCIGCVEDRLGRTVSVEDFRDTAVNDPDKHRRSTRLIQRLGRRS